MNYWQHWLRKPQGVWLRKAIFQIHLWSGIALGLYILLISVTGSVLVYRNELYTATTPDTIIATPSGPRLSDEQLKEAAAPAFPGYTIAKINRARNLDQAVTITLEKGAGHKNRLVDPYTGADLGDPVPLGFWMVSKLLELHDDLLGGRTGRRVNGFGAIAILVLTLTGIVVWWPGIARWRRSLMLQRNVGWQRLTWDLHSMMGFWTLGVILIFALSGIYLSDPQPFQDLADKIQPPTDFNGGTRIVDKVVYWLAYLHFGRICGIGIPCRGPGVCDQTTKFVWAISGLAPAAMFLTGALMWWNRVVRKKLR